MNHVQHDMEMGANFDELAALRESQQQTMKVLWAVVHLVHGGEVRVPASQRMVSERDWALVTTVDPETGDLVIKSVLTTEVEANCGRGVPS